MAPVKIRTYHVYVHQHGRAHFVAQLAEEVGLTPDVVRATGYGVDEKDAVVQMCSNYIDAE